MSEPNSLRLLRRIDWLQYRVGEQSQEIFDIKARLDVLEQKQETQRLATLAWGKDIDKLMRWIDDHLKRIMALEQSRQDKLDRLIEQDRDDEDDEDLRGIKPAGIQSATPEGVPVVTDLQLEGLFAQAGMGAYGRRAIYDLGLKHGTPPVVVEALQLAKEALRVISEGTAVMHSELCNCRFAARACLPIVCAALTLLGVSERQAEAELASPEEAAR